ncbi:MAG: phosphoribosyl-AMP cyclohydrolase [Betaproteobacteria bacterium]|nr:phosphoribosyl-AMP cyclohydrolase [Burkholderiales bacterium]MBL6878927.1 phosphoribosyl-AMP cyclohydrolase [Burkholderiales bacterium]MBT6412631.1 phosphoribosyl-AMP cyclohydrolase [Betaproteobacteria bacterium]HAT53274.1 phosphoribosyl-AMP cyclohydrolase [Betaproteobacteria bacterium]HAU83326.1 phosphoribosyl-AMP cyclohydrolase [Betaproteobacteria bacterium]
MKSLISDIQWDDRGLVTVVVQDYKSAKILMVAWANEAAIIKSIEDGRACFWSRSRSALWLKGESSGHYQLIKDIYLDCDGDTLVFKVEQVGGIACHTGRNSCFFKRLDKGEWVNNEPVIKNEEDIYGKHG